MSLSTSQIAAVIREIAPVLTGGWIQKVHQPAPRAIVLEARVSGQTLSLYCTADPETARMHVLTARLPNPAAPPPFCQFLRAHIQGARIDGIEQDHRIIRLRLTAREGACSLIANLAGRHADLLVVDADDKILMSLNTAQERAGQPYHAPVPHQGRTDSDQLEVPSASSGQPFPVSFALEQEYQRREEERDHSRLRHARLAELKKQIKRTVRRIAALQADLEKAMAYREYARYGELLKANLGGIQKGQESVTVIDYFDTALPELTISLDSAKTPHANMDDYFRKHRKYLTAEQEILPRLGRAEQELHALQAERTAVEQAAWEPPAGPAPQRSKKREASTAHGLPSERKQKQPRSGPFKRFLSADDLPIYVGRNARENDDLTFNFARSDDLWLHAHGTPGSHVVVRLEKGANPPPETLRDAATLALLYSDLKKSGKGEVIYTRRKWVRKAKGRPAGSVTVTQEKAIFITLDRTRLDRLKERSA
jgi:predicted ribosome quality control (RQC) complex YloA/Tae2 family protein